jgi:polyhydroxybutyrate depolymerase
VLSAAGEELRVSRTVYAGGEQGSEVVLIVIEGGGHTWPGRQPPVPFLGKSTPTVAANDLIWEFFQKHTLK